MNQDDIIKQFKKDVAEGKVEFEEPKQWHHKYKHHIRGFFAIIVAVLIISNIGLGYNFLLQLQGRIESEEILAGNTLIFKNLTIKMSDSVYDAILSKYRNNDGNEIKFCLTGHIEKEIYLVQDQYIPEISYNNAVTVHSKPCNDETIIDLHSHPGESCLFSDQDVKTYNRIKKRNKNVIMLLMCTETRFSHLK